MELASVIARVSQLEKDLAEARAKVFFLEAVINEQRSQRQLQPIVAYPYSPPATPPSVSDAYAGFAIGGEGESPQRRVSPFSFSGFSSPPQEETLGSELQVAEEMFDES